MSMSYEELSSKYPADRTLVEKHKARMLAEIDNLGKQKQTSDNNTYNNYSGEKVVINDLNNLLKNHVKKEKPKKLSLTSEDWEEMVEKINDAVYPDGFPDSTY